MKPALEATEGQQRVISPDCGNQGRHPKRNGPELTSEGPTGYLANEREREREGGNVGVTVGGRRVTQAEGPACVRPGKARACA